LSLSKHSLYTFFGKIKKGIKDAEFGADFKSVWETKKFAKIYKQNYLTIMSKNGKSSYVRHIFGNNFFVSIFTTFLIVLKSE
jgi:hypothetical protein